MEQSGSASEKTRIASPARGVRLTNRDRQLLGVLATARYFSSEQIQRLFFSGRTEAACRGRLFLLARLGKQRTPFSYLKRLRFRSFEGQWFSVWAPTLQGYSIAQRVLGVEVKVPAYDVSASFLEHSIRLNDLLVALLETARGRMPSAAGARFRWIPSDSSRLPWHDYEDERGTVKRVIQPDAILEIPTLRRRFFLECEMGTHPIVSANPDKHGATVNKLERYNDFMASYADDESTKTCYQQLFPDRWDAELLFLVHSPIRRNHVTLAIEKAQEKLGDGSVAARALTFEEAQVRLRKLVETADPRQLEPEPVVPLSSHDFRELTAFYNTSITSLKKARAQIRSLKMPQLNIPEYPSNSEKVADLLDRLRTILFPKPRPAA